VANSSTFILNFDIPIVSPAAFRNGGVSRLHHSWNDVVSKELRDLTFQLETFGESAVNTFDLQTQDPPRANGH